MQVHLANGRVIQLDDAGMERAFGDGPIVAYIDAQGIEHMVIGVYPDPVQTVIETQTDTPEPTAKSDTTGKEKSK